MAVKKQADELNDTYILPSLQIYLKGIHKLFPPKLGEDASTLTKKFALFHIKERTVTTSICLPQNTK